MLFTNDTLYVTDLDGTLLGAEPKIPPQAVEQLNQMLDAGLCFTVATARSWSSAEPLVRQLRIHHPVVAYNGAFLIDPVTGEALDRCLFRQEQMERIADVFVRGDIWPMVYAEIEGRQKVSWVKAHQHAGITRYARSRAGDPRLNPVESLQQLFLGDVFYFSALGKKEALEHLVEPLMELPFIHVNFMADSYDLTEYWLEVSRADATKAIGVSKLRTLTGIDKIVCFGDNLNDIPMFQVADECYAVANARQELKDIATGVIGSNLEMGVPAFLKTRAAMC